MRIMPVQRASAQNLDWRVTIFAASKAAVLLRMLIYGIGIAAASSPAIAPWVATGSIQVQGPSMSRQMRSYSHHCSGDASFDLGAAATMFRSSCRLWALCRRFFNDASPGELERTAFCDLL